MLKFILFGENTYPIRKATIEGYGHDWVIATDDLESVLISEDGDYTSPEARLIDEHILFYVPKSIAVDCSDEEVAEFVRRYMN